MLTRLICLLILPFIALPSHSAGNESPIYNQVYIDAQVEGEVVNDLLEVVLAVEKQGTSPDAIARQLNETMQWALGLSKSHKDVEVSTKSYQTYPLHKDRLIVGWRAVQQLQLKSTNIPGLTELAGKLQDKLQVQQMNFMPTPETRVKLENALINEAMDSFKERVEIIKVHMEDKNYRIVDLRVNTGQSVPGIYRERMVGMAAMSADAAPAVEAGTSKVIVTISGSVQFF